MRFQRLIRVATRAYGSRRVLGAPRTHILARGISSEGPTKPDPHHGSGSIALQDGVIPKNSIGVSSAASEGSMSILKNKDEEIVGTGNNHDAQLANEVIESNGINMANEEIKEAEAVASQQEVSAESEPKMADDRTTLPSKDSAPTENLMREESEGHEQRPELRLALNVIPAAECKVDPLNEDMLSLYSELKYVNRNYGMYQLIQRFREAREKHPAFSEDIYNLVVPIFARLKFVYEMKECIRTAHEYGVPLRTRTYNAVLYTLMRKGFEFDIRDLISVMWEAGPGHRPDAYSYNHLISVLFMRRRVQDAFQVLDEMKEKGIVPNLSSYLSLIFGCVKAGDPHRAYEVFQTLEKSGAELSSLSIAHLLVACAQHGDIEAVSDLLDKFESALPDYASQIENLNEDTRASAAMKTLNITAKFESTAMEERRREPGPIRLEFAAFDPILQTAYDSGNEAVANRAWALLRKSYPDVEIPPRLWYKVIGANGRAGDFERAFQLIGEYEKLTGSSVPLQQLMEGVVSPLAKDMTAVDKIYNSLKSRALAEHGANSVPEEYIEESNEVEEQIEAEAGGNAGMSSQTEKDSSKIIQDKSGEFDLEPSVTTLNCLVAACGRARDSDRTFQTFDDISNVFHLSRNTDSYNALLFALIARSSVVSIERVVDDMKRSKVPMNSETIRMVIQTYISIGRSIQSIRWVRYAMEKDINVSVRVFQNMLASFFRYPELPEDRVQEVLDLGRACGHSLTALMTKLRYNDRAKLWKLEGIYREELRGSTEGGGYDEQSDDRIDEEAAEDSGLTREHGILENGVEPSAEEELAKEPAEEGHTFDDGRVNSPSEEPFDHEGTIGESATRETSQDEIPRIEEASGDDSGEKGTGQTEESSSEDFGNSPDSEAPTSRSGIE